MVGVALFLVPLPISLFPHHCSRTRIHRQTVICKLGRRNNQDDIIKDTDPPKGPSPAEVTGFHGWRSEDDAYWLRMRRHEKQVRGPHIAQFDPESQDLGPPLGRDGKPVRYPGAARYDQEQGCFVPVTEEEERILRSDYPNRDPFFIEEAPEGESYKADCSRSEFSAEEIVELTNVNYSATDKPNKERGYAIRRIPADAPPPKRRVGYTPQLATTKRRRLNLAPGAWRLVHLGTSSAVPTRLRNVSSTAFLSAPMHGNGEPDMVLVDAGENTEERLLDALWSMSHGFRWIRAVFITHLHGDHIYGLPGLLRAIGEYCQFRRRNALENDAPEPVIRIYGPYGTRGFLRSSLYWTNPIGVRFSVAELVPRDFDFAHIQTADNRARTGGGIVVIENGVERRIDSDDDRVFNAMPPPHPEEERVDDVQCGPDGTWHVWGDANDPNIGFEVVAAPLKHRLPCFGYVFRGPKRRRMLRYENGIRERVEIDVEKARALGVYGPQYRVLRDRRPVIIRKTGRTVTLDDVSRKPAEPDVREMPVCGTRKVVILGDTCDSSLIADAAMDADILIHEATFDNQLKVKAAQSLHSTAGMAGAFAARVKAKKLVLTHFSSRYEVMSISEAVNVDYDSSDSDDLISTPRLLREASQQCDSLLVAANDYMEHTIDIDGSVVTKDRRFNRHAVINAYRDASSTRSQSHNMVENEESLHVDDAAHNGAAEMSPKSEMGIGVTGNDAVTSPDVAGASSNTQVEAQ